MPDFDVAIISLSLVRSDGLRLCSQLRSVERTRHLPLIVMVEPGEDARLLRGLDMGVNDYLIRPIDKHEMLARVRTQIKRKRYSDFLRNRIEETVEQAVTDALTGLHNRRYMESHLETLVRDALRAGRKLSMLMADIDFFKHVNDTYGHDAGDVVLREFANRIRRNTRGIDLACRMGGEEFVIIMPDTEMGRAVRHQPQPSDSGNHQCRASQHGNGRRHRANAIQAGRSGALCVEAFGAQQGVDSSLIPFLDDLYTA